MLLGLMEHTSLGTINVEKHQTLISPNIKISWRANASMRLTPLLYTLKQNKEVRAKNNVKTTSIKYKVKWWLTLSAIDYISYKLTPIIATLGNC